MQTEIKRLALTIDECAKAIGMSPRYVAKLVQLGRIPYLKLGRSVRFLPGDIEKWLERRRAKVVS